MTEVGGQHLPPAKFSIIAGHVWLLEKTGAANKFLVFGNDVEVLKRWQIIVYERPGPGAEQGEIRISSIQGRRI